jgi:hypothetical protein
MKAKRHSASSSAGKALEPRSSVRTEAASRRVAISPEQRRTMIEQAAYYRAEKRGFAPGGELEDWLWAEAEIDRALGEPALLERQLAHSDT